MAELKVTVTVMVGDVERTRSYHHYCLRKCRGSYPPEDKFTFFNKTHIIHHSPLSLILVISPILQIYTKQIQTCSTIIIIIILAMCGGL